MAANLEMQEVPLNNNETKMATEESDFEDLPFQGGIVSSRIESVHAQAGQILADHKSKIALVTKLTLFLLYNIYFFYAIGYYVNSGKSSYSGTFSYK